MQNDNKQQRPQQALRVLTARELMSIAGGAKKKAKKKASDTPEYFTKECLVCNE